MIKGDCQPVEETFHTVCKMIASRYEAQGWKYLKSQRCIKKIIHDLVFEIRFFGSKWNTMGQSITINGECSIWYKKMDNKLSVNSSIGYFAYRPLKSNNGSSETSWDITYENQFSAVAEDICNFIDTTAIPLSECFESDFNGTIRKLAQNNLKSSLCMPLNVRLEFIDQCVGREYAEIFARNYFASLNDDKKKCFISDLELYQKGLRNKAHMINPCTFKYIVDKNISFT